MYQFHKKITIALVVICIVNLCTTKAEALRPVSYKNQLRNISKTSSSSVNRRTFLKIAILGAIAAKAGIISFPREAMAISPIKEIDKDDIINIKLQPYQEYEIYKIKDEEVYYIEFSSLKVQDRAFMRLGVFVESDDYAGQVLDDKTTEAILKDRPELGGIGYNFSISDICRFYAMAKKRGVELNLLEKELKEDFLRYGFIAFDKGEYISSRNIAIISAAQDIDTKYGIKGIREDTISHELNHGIYMTDNWYRTEVRTLWNSLTEGEQAAISYILQRLGGYNVEDKDLIIMEFAAHCRRYYSELYLYVPRDVKNIVSDHEPFFLSLQGRLIAIEKNRYMINYVIRHFDGEKLTKEGLNKKDSPALPKGNIKDKNLLKEKTSELTRPNLTSRVIHRRELFAGIAAPFVSMLGFKKGNDPIAASFNESNLKQDSDTKDSILSPNFPKPKPMNINPMDRSLLKGFKASA